VAHSSKETFGDPTGHERVIIHVDMDSFFVSALLRDRPELVEKPVAVAWSKGDSSEVSSCNYVARRSGVTKGMWMLTAKAKCPELVTLPYNFELYDDISLAIYTIFFEAAPRLEALSCDEAVLEFPIGTDGDRIAREIRDNIYSETRCHASAGVGHNRVVAKMAASAAKPNGQRWVRFEDAGSFVAGHSLRELPGIGREHADTLAQEGLLDSASSTCSDVVNLGLARLQVLFGETQGDNLFRYSKGLDHREVANTDPTPKSVGAECNWGLRVHTQPQVEAFIRGIASEVADRMEVAGLEGSTVTLRIKKRKADAPTEPTKFLGHGPCDTFSRSQTLGVATALRDVLGATALSLWKTAMTGLCPRPDDLRGLGVSVTRLEEITGGQPQQGRIGAYFNTKSLLGEPSAGGSDDQVVVEVEREVSRHIELALAAGSIEGIQAAGATLREALCDPNRHHAHEALLSWVRLQTLKHEMIGTTQAQAERFGHEAAVAWGAQLRRASAPG